MAALLRSQTLSTAARSLGAPSHSLAPYEVRVTAGLARPPRVPNGSSSSDCRWARGGPRSCHLAVKQKGLRLEDPGRPDTRRPLRCRCARRSAPPRGRVTMSAAFVDFAGLAGPACQVSAHDLLMTATCVGGAWAWVRIFDELARHRLLEQKLSRKIVHITTGLIFYSLWPFFSPAPSARFLAAVAPSANIARLLALGNGIAKDDAAVRSISREGDPKELLRGPLYYVLVMAFVTLSFWRTSPVGGIALALMCGGDGFADIVGRRVGGGKLPWNSRKSWAGSAAMFLFGFPLALGAAYLFHVFGFYEISFWSAAARVAVIAAGATVMESLPITDVLDDNITVPLTCIGLGLLLFPPAL